MYRTPYKTMNRIQSIEEAIAIPIPRQNTDFFLWLIDTYDVLLSITESKLPVPTKTQLADLRKKLNTCILDNYNDQYRPIPGAVYGWTVSMFIWIILLSVIEMQHQTSTLEISENVKKYCKEKRIRMWKDPDLTTWNFDTVASQLDCISLRWHTLEPCKELEELLEILWRFAARFTLRMHTKDVLNVESYVEEIPNMVHLRLSAQGIMVFLSRYYWFHNTIRYYRKWQHVRDEEFPTIEESNWNTWILNERRHFITRRFRDGIAEWMWDKLILFGDQEIASHDQLGDEVSSFTCMYARFPAGLVSYLQRVLTYKDYKEISEEERISDFAHLHMIHAHFSNTYNVGFLKYFFIYDKTMYKHIDAIQKCSTPLILLWYKKYVVYFLGKIYHHPEGYSVQHAFIMWVVLLRKHCNGKCYDSMDFNSLCEQILDQAEVVNNDRHVDGFFDLDDD